MAPSHTAFLNHLGSTAYAYLSPALSEVIIALAGARVTLITMPKSGSTTMVAVVDDDESCRAALERLLRSEGFPVQSFASAEDFLTSGKQRETGCLIADIRMPGMSGLDLQVELNADHCPIPTIFISAHGDEKIRLRAMRGGAVKFLAKPFDGEILLETVRSALKS